MATDGFLQTARIFSEISQGYSQVKIENTYCYIKHLTFAEQFFLSNRYEEIEEDARALGLESEKEKINFAIKEGWWSLEKEERVDFLKKAISNLEKTKQKLLYKSQRDAAEVQIKQYNSILTSYLYERNDFVGYTVENYVEKKSNEELIRKQLYKDSFLTEFYFSAEQEISEDNLYLNKIFEQLGKIHSLFNINNIKMVAASGFFQNLIFLTDDPYNFWGKPLINCSKYQSDLLLYGKSYRNFVKGQAENGKPINENILNDPEKLISLIENYRPEKNGRSKYNFNRDGSNAVSSYVGATKEDLDQLGVKVEKIQGKSLLELAKESGGVLEKEDYLKARV